METAILKDNTFLNEWLRQIHTKVSHIPDNILAEALNYIETKGIPGIKDEQYRYVPIENILKRNFRNIRISDNQQVSLPNEFSQQKNIIYLHPNKTINHQTENGIDIFYQNNIPDRFHLLLKKSNIHQTDFFAALNTAYCPNLIIIHIQQSLKEPLYLYHITDTNSNFAQNRILIFAEKNADFSVFEQFDNNTSKQMYFYNAVSEIYLSENSNCKWISFQNNSSNNLYSVNNTAFHLSASAHLKHHQISLNGMLWRNNINIHINDKEAHSELKGLSFGKNQSVISQNTATLHHSGYAYSNQLYKNIADDKSTVLFNGFILVDKNAQKTNAYQSSKNLLLNDNATVFAKPQLEIYADDVKCSHGSSTGALNEDALLYLRARGIDKNAAQKLLLHAFYSDIIESIENTDIQAYIKNQTEW